MKKFFCFRLAFSNIKKNLATLIPFYIICVFAVSRFYIINAVTLTFKDTNVNNSAALVLNRAIAVTGIFAIVFLLYIYSLIMKRRKNEFAMYSVLGMSKNSISAVVLAETFIMGTVGIVTGILYGVVFGRLAYMLLLRALRCEVTLKMSASLTAMARTAVLFAIIFVAIQLYLFVKLRFSENDSLIKNDVPQRLNKRTGITAFVTGGLFIATGYVISVALNNALYTKFTFLAAALLVVAGTYLLAFSSGSVLLGFAQKNKKFYYSSRHFVSLNFTMSRIKQSAFGLATLCVLLTAMLTLVSTGVCFYNELEDTVRETHPFDYTISSFLEDETAVTNVVDNMFSSTELTSYNSIKAKAAYAIYNNSTDCYKTTSPHSNSSNMIRIVVLELDQYNKRTGSNAVLEQGHALVFNEPQAVTDNKLNIENNTFVIDTESGSLPTSFTKEIKAPNPVIVVVNDINVFNSNSGFSDCINIGFNVNASVSEQAQYYEKLCDAFNTDNTNIIINSKAVYSQDFYGTYGEFMYVVIFLGTLFIVATLVVIYYKQMFESFEDRKSFQIMQSAGMSKAEVMKSIRQQVHIMFFLPLSVAILHLMFVLPFIIRVFNSMNLTNMALLLFCVAATVVVSAALYFVVYKLTARMYYKVVK